ncbi:MULTISPECIES: PP2C family protein-serine/threonine phosphatase [Salipiger]|uniref:Serine phosphatase RsbU, regulator of sigma subunit n=1 Tax=Salipiger profundus TaxID=1229727 RepID=A0A1U7D3G8_9RHOB|nr:MULTISPECIES: fused response regulator/phosphatase [Salipiger]APX22717.1 serine phosphatase RsbU, regulator of sigma subunit [Salipiger profundus]GGA10179.1 fused response regulator/phosphatase [Salipiger profundus]SFC63401.1 sigma-B regulation protein RsbU (phosphoserine phosphatase) [Salipiger profundus]
MHPDPLDIRAAAPSADVLRRVLVVDDSPAQLKILVAMMRHWGFEVWQADNASDALELCHRIAPDAVLSDWMMPGMDGLEFCRRFRALDRDNYGYFILLTSKNEKGAIARGLDAGADDFLTKPVHADELRARINAGARILTMERQLGDTLGRLQSAYDAIDRDLRQARHIQQALVPVRSRDFGAARVSLLLKPCGHVGGDLVGMFGPNGGSVGVYGFDVSGHGITSALMTARVAGHLGNDFPALNIALTPGGTALRPPEDVARQLNDRLAADPGVLEYLTMAYLTLELASGRIGLVQAGHPPPLLIRADGGLSFVGTGGLPIGLIGGARYDRIGLSLKPGDRILLYSDGLTEAELTTGGLLDQSGLASLVAQCRGSEGTEFLDDLYWRLSQVTRRGTRLADDVSAALVEYAGPEGSA